MVRQSALLMAALALIMSMHAHGFQSPVPGGSTHFRSLSPLSVQAPRMRKPAALGLRCAEGSSRKKVAMIGAGNVGATAAFILAQKSLADMVLLDIDGGVAQGKALDMMQAGSVLGYDVKMKGTTSYADIAGSDIVVVTSGLPRTPGMTRDDLVRKNGDVIAEVAAGVKEHSPDAIVIVVTNPLDLMAYHFQKKSGLPAERVIGMAGVLDSARMAYFVASSLDRSVRDVSSMVLGGHGDSMVPLLSSATIGGVPISHLLSSDQLHDISERTAKGGGEIVQLLGRGSAFYAPGAATAAMVESILLDQKRILPCSVRLSGEYGLDDIYIGVPVVVGASGAEGVVEVPLTDEESAKMHATAAECKQLLASALDY